MSFDPHSAQNFAPIISSMVLEPSFFDIFFMFSQFWVFYGPGYGLGRGLGLPWDSQGASWGFLGPQGAQKGGFWVLGGGGPGGALSRVCPGSVPGWHPLL